MKKHLSTIIVVIIFFCGLALFLYPMVSNIYNNHLNDKLIGEYEEDMQVVIPGQYEDIKKDAYLYNENINNGKVLKELGLTYDELLNLGGNGSMGYIEIPKISVSLMIYHTVEEDKLQDGIGHVEGTALPVGGKNTHCVLAGHTGLPSSKLLTNLDRMEIGDKFYIHVLDEVLEYKVDNISVVEPEDAELISVVSGKDHVTIVTCTPYGINSHRLLVRGIRSNGQISDEDEGTKLDVQNDIEIIEMKYLITISMIVITLITGALYKIKRW